MDIKQQIQYWVVTAEEDFAAAQSLLDKEHFRHCLFFAHLAVEKMLKAHVVKTTQQIPPKIHNLIRLSEITKLHLKDEHLGFLRRFGLYQLEGRYPDTAQALLDITIVKESCFCKGNSRMAENAIITTIQNYLALLAPAGIHATKAILFGSFAKNSQTVWSDIDLIVIAPEFDGIKKLKLIETLWQKTAIDSRIEPIPCGEEEWELDQSRPILEIARSEGVVVNPLN